MSFINKIEVLSLLICLKVSLKDKLQKLKSSEILEHVRKIIEIKKLNELGKKKKKKKLSEIKYPLNYKNYLHNK